MAADSSPEYTEQEKEIIAGIAHYQEQQKWEGGKKYKLLILSAGESSSVPVVSALNFNPLERVSVESGLRVSYVVIDLLVDSLMSASKEGHISGVVAIGYTDYKIVEDEEGMPDLLYRPNYFFAGRAFASETELEEIVAFIDESQQEQQEAIMLFMQLSNSSDAQDEGESYN